MTDCEFLHAFESCTLPEEEWTHRAHLRMAWLRLRDGDFNTVLPRVREGIQRYNTSIGKPKGYHETITQAYLRLVEHRMRAGDTPAFDAFCAQNADLLAPDLGALTRHYRRKTLLCPEARHLFVEPDLLPLPLAAAPR